MNSTQIIALFFCVSIIVLVFFDVIKREKVEKNNFFSKEQTNWLRGIAILMVIHSHYFADIGISENFSGVPLFLVSSIGFLGVGLFIFMSGYATMISYVNKPNYLKRYIPKRIVRLYVPFLLSFIFFLGGMLCFGIYPTLDDWLAIPLMSLPHTLNWYLKIQLILYIVFYLLAVWIKKKPFIIMAMSIVCLIYTIIASSIGIQNYWFESVLLFPVGMAFALYKIRITDFILRKKVLNFVVSLFILAFTFLLYYYRGGVAFEIMFIFSFVLLSVNLCGIIIGTSKVLKWMGSMSLELYLSHIVFANTIMHYGNLFGNIWGYLLFMLGTILLGMGIHIISKKLIRVS